MKALAFTLFCLFAAVSEGKQFEKCELAAHLKRYGMDGYNGYSLDLWMCMIYHGSEYNSKTMKTSTQDRSRNYGLFQLNSRWWCSSGKSKTANGCRRPCNAFIDDDIRDDIACVKMAILKPSKMNGWAHWNQKCKPENVTGWTRGCKL